MYYFCINKTESFICTCLPFDVLTLLHMPERTDQKAEQLDAHSTVIFSSACAGHAHPWSL